MKIFKFESNQLTTNNTGAIKNQLQQKKAQKGKWYHYQRIYVIKPSEANPTYGLVSLNIFERFARSVFNVNLMNKYFKNKTIKFIPPKRFIRNFNVEQTNQKYNSIIDVKNDGNFSKSTSMRPSEISEKFIQRLGNSLAFTSVTTKKCSHLDRLPFKLPEGTSEVVVVEFQPSNFGILGKNVDSGVDLEKIVKFFNGEIDDASKEISQVAHLRAGLKIYFYEDTNHQIKAKAELIKP